MSKSTRMTPEQLRAMGLEEYAPGQYRPKKKASNEEQLSVEINSKELLPTLKDYTDNVLEPALKEYANGVIDDMKRKNPVTPDECIKPFDIAAIRALGSGTKKRKQSMDDLHRFAKELVENRGVDSIYIKGNVASSKNSKEIAKFKKKVMGKTVEMTSLIDSKATRAYRTETSRQWGAHLQHFKDIVKDKQYPLHIHFTFIRSSIGRFDLINAAQGPLDIMVEKGYIEDDSSEHVIPVFNPVVYYSKEYAGLLIKVL